MRISKKKKSIKGFSFVEITLILVIFTSLITALIALAPLDTKIVAEINTEQRIKHIDKAIKAFYNANGYLPCPAPLNATLNTVSFAVATDCSVTPAPAGTTDVGAGNERIRIGMIPTRTLNLPDSFALDAWNNRISYVVVAGLSQNKAAYDAYTSTLATSKPIIINDQNANQKHADNNSTTNPNIVAYAVFSHGRLAEGATNRLGTGLIMACGGTTLDSENCDNDETFIEAPHNYTSGATYYDDYIFWKTLPNFKNEARYISTSSKIVDIAVITDRNYTGVGNYPYASASTKTTRFSRTISGNDSINPVTLVKTTNTTSISSTSNHYAAELFFPTWEPNDATSLFTLPVGKYNINAMITHGFDTNAYPWATTPQVGAPGIIQGATEIWGLPNNSAQNSGIFGLSINHVPVYSYWNLVGTTSFELAQYSQGDSLMGFAAIGFSTGSGVIVPQTYYVEIWKY